MKEDLLLGKLGLTKNESTIYLYLLRRGLCSGVDIHRSNNMDKSAAYKALTSLMQQDLVYSVGQSRNQQFSAYPVQRLEEIVEAKGRELEQVKVNLSNLVADIEEYARRSYKEKNIKLFSGNDEFEAWSKDRLTAPKGDIIRKISSTKLQSTFTPDYDKYSVEMPRLRVERGIHMREIYSQADLDFHKQFSSIIRTDAQLLKEVRRFPKNTPFDISASFATYDDKVAFLAKREDKFFGIIIADSLIKKVLDQMFDIVWSTCEIIV